MALAISSSWEEVAGVPEPEPMAWRKGVSVVVWLSGEQDASTAAAVTERLDAAAARGEGDVVVDLSRVAFMDAAIVGALLRCQDRLRLQSRHFRLRSPSKFARRVLHLCGLDELAAPAPTATITGIDSCVLLHGPV